MRRVVILIGCLGVSLSACSSGTSPPNPASQAPASAVVTSPAVISPPSMATPEAAAQPEIASPDVPDGGTVISTLDVPGSKTMYMELENNGKRFWIASATIEVKAGDSVTYDQADAVVMQNFASKALGRTFDEVILVANAKKATK